MYYSLFSLKAARRAVDTVIDFTGTLNLGLNITKVMAVGLSKRGWTSQLLAATDRRVFAFFSESLAPMSNDEVRHVIDKHMMRPYMRACVHFD